MKHQLNAQNIDLDGLLRQLRLPTMRRLYPKLADTAEEKNLSYRDFLAVLIAEEVAQRLLHPGRLFLHAVQTTDQPTMLVVVIVAQALSQQLFEVCEIDVHAYL